MLQRRQGSVFLEILPGPRACHCDHTTPATVHPPAFGQCDSWDNVRIYASTSCISPSVRRPRQECMGLNTPPCSIIRNKVSSDFRNEPARWKLAGVIVSSKALGPSP